MLLQPALKSRIPSRIPRAYWALCVSYVAAVVVLQRVAPQFVGSAAITWAVIATVWNGYWALVVFMPFALAFPVLTTDVSASGSTASSLRLVTIVVLCGYWLRPSAFTRIVGISGLSLACVSICVLFPLCYMAAHAAATLVQPSYLATLMVILRFGVLLTVVVALQREEEVALCVRALVFASLLALPSLYYTFSVFGSANDIRGASDDLFVTNSQAGLGAQQANDYSFVAVAIGVLGLGVAQWSSSHPRNKNLLRILSILVMLLFWVGARRVGLLAFSIALLMLPVVSASLGRRAAGIAKGVTLAAVLTGIFLLVPQIRETWSERESLSSELGGGGTGRWEIWRETSRLLQEVPTFGYGPGSTAYLLPKTGAGDAHNTVLQAALETGLLGAGILLIGLVGLILVALPRLRQGPQQAHGAVAFFSLIPFFMAQTGWSWSFPLYVLGVSIAAMALRFSRPTDCSHVRASRLS